MGRKIVINKCFGGFCVSAEAVKLGRERLQRWAMHPNCLLDGERYEDGSGTFFASGENECSGYWDIERDDPDFVSIVEDLGEKASGRFADLKVVEIPKHIDWEIEDYDGIESVHEVHRVWR